MKNKDKLISKLINVLDWSIPILIILAFIACIVFGVWNFIAQMQYDGQYLT
jgi:disulfide bond formation protein DsbB